MREFAIKYDAVFGWAMAACWAYGSHDGPGTFGCIVFGLNALISLWTVSKREEAIARKHFDVGVDAATDLIIDHLDSATSRELLNRLRESRAKK